MLVEVWVSFSRRPKLIVPAAPHHGVKPHSGIIRRPFQAIPPRAPKTPSARGGCTHVRAALVGRFADLPDRLRSCRRAPRVCSPESLRVGGAGKWRWRGVCRAGGLAKQGRSGEPRSRDGRGGWGCGRRFGCGGHGFSSTTRGRSGARSLRANARHPARAARPPRIADRIADTHLLKTRHHQNRRHPLIRIPRIPRESQTPTHRRILRSRIADTHSLKTRWGRSFGLRITPSCTIPTTFPSNFSCL